MVDLYFRDYIHQFSESRNKDPKNGIALCKNAHSMFDQGLWALGDDYRVIVAHSAFDENTCDQKSLRDFHGLQVALLLNTKLLPDPPASCLALRIQVLCVTLCLHGKLTSHRSQK